MQLVAAASAAAAAAAAQQQQLQQRNVIMLVAQQTSCIVDYQQILVLHINDSHLFTNDIGLRVWHTVVIFEYKPPFTTMGDSDTKKKEYDVRFKTPFTCLLAGPSQSGKTSLVFNMLRDRANLCDTPTNNIFYFYNLWQPVFASFQEEGTISQWLPELPTIAVLKELTEPHMNAEGSIVIIDDFMGQLNKDISDLFTVFCHSNRCSVFLMTQNVFAKNPFFRTISLNALYVFIFKNPRDSSQISHYAQQFAPGNTQWVVDAFRECTRAGYSYMLFDHHQTQHEEVRARSHILPSQWPIRVWGPRQR
jgi:hypothetical protein